MFFFYRLLQIYTIGAMLVVFLSCSLYLLLLCRGWYDVVAAMIVFLMFNLLLNVPFYLFRKLVYNRCLVKN